MVAVRKRKLVDLDCGDICQYEYLIIGRRISDNNDVLSCTIKRDFVYNRVMPTFHHWRTGNKKFGLTFQTAADARTFDKGITSAVEDLLDGGGEVGGQINLDVGESDVFMMVDLPRQQDNSHPSTPNSRSPPPKTNSPCPGLSPRSPLSPSSRSPNLPPSSPRATSPLSRLTPTPSSPTHRPDAPLLNQLDGGRLLTRSNTVGGTGRGRESGFVRGRGSLRLGDPPPPGDNIYEWLHASEKLPPFRNDSGSHLHTDSGSGSSDKYYVITPGYNSQGLDKDSFSDTYVRFDIKDQDPQYYYPNLDSLPNVLPPASANKSVRRSSISSLKWHPSSGGLGLEDTFVYPLKEKGSKGKKGKGRKGGGGVLRLQQERCAHCQELYTESENKRGSCRYSPDVVRQGIDCVSCLSCAKCLLYHCHYEDENFSEEEICTCADTDGHLAKRWLGLSLLAVLVPCLCLYPVLTACYTCGRACHACGGKHVPV